MDSVTEKWVQAKVCRAKGLEETALCEQLRVFICFPATIHPGEAKGRLGLLGDLETPRCEKCYEPYITYLLSMS